MAPSSAKYQDKDKLRKAWDAVDFEDEGQLALAELEVLMQECALETQIEYDIGSIHRQLIDRGHHETFPWEAFQEIIHNPDSLLCLSGRSGSTSSSTSLLMDSPSKRSNRYLPDAIAKRPMSCNIAKSSGLLSPFHAEEPQGRRPSLTLHIKLKKSTPSKIDATGPSRTKKDILSSPKANSGGWAEGVGLEQQSNESDTSSHGESLEQLELEATSDDSTMESSRRSISAHSEVKAQPEPPLSASSRTTERSNQYGLASARFREISRKVVKRNQLDVKLGRKVANPNALKSFSAVTQAALNAHKKHIYTSVCETAALTVWKSMPVIKEPAPQEIERKFNRIDRFWGPASFVLSLYYFWRVALSICYKTPMAWGWFEVIILLILGLMELGQIWLELHRPIDVKGQKVYKFPEIWRVQSRKTRFWLDVVSALPVAYVLIYWLQSDTTWVPFCFIIKWFNALWNLPSHFNDAMEKMRVDPIKGRIFRAAFIFVMTAHIMACVFFVVARTQGDEATQYITTIPNLVSGGKVLYPYTHAFDWAIKTMTGLSRGNGIPLTDVQHCLLLSTVTTGIILYALMITTISDALTTPSLEARHRDHLQMVNDTMVYQDLPQDFRKDVLAYYRYNFRSTGRVGGGDDEDPLGDLPYDFRSKIDCAIGSAILKRVPIFAKACENQKFLEVMVQKLQPQALMPETVVFHRGTVGDTMFFIVNGQVAVLADNGKEVVVLGAGAFFGEIAMLSDTERTATIVTKTYCHVLVLNKADFLAVSEQFTDSMASIKELAQSRVQALMKRQEEERRTLLGKVPLFAGAIEDAGFLEMMVQSLQSKVFAPEMFICHRGDVGDCMYFLVGGQVAILDAHGEEVVALGPGCFFGEIALLENIERTATIAAKMFCTTLLLSKQKFEEVEKMYPQPIQEIRKAAQPRIDEVLAAQSSDKAKLIQSVPIFKEAAETPGFVQMLVNALFSKVFPPKTFVCKRGDRGDCMYFVVSGSVAIIGEDLEEKVVLGPGTFFGEIALLMDTTRTATVRTKTTVTVMVFNRLDFNQCGHAYPTCLQTIRDASSERIAAAKRAEEEARLLNALDPMVELADTKSQAEAEVVAQRRFSQISHRSRRGSGINESFAVHGAESPNAADATPGRSPTHTPMDSHRSPSTRKPSHTSQCDGEAATETRDGKPTMDSSRSTGPNRAPIPPKQSSVRTEPKAVLSPKKSEGMTTPTSGPRQPLLLNPQGEDEVAFQEIIHAPDSLSCLSGRSGSTSSSTSLLMDSPSKRSNRYLPDAIAKRPMSCNIAKSSGLLSPFHAEEPQGRRPSLTLHIKLKKSTPSKIDATGPPRTKKDILSSPKANSGGLAEGVGLEQQSNESDTSSHGESLEQLELEATSDDSTMESSRRSISAHSEVKAQPQPPLSASSRTTERSNQYGLASARFRGISRKVVKRNQLDVKLGRKVANPNALKSFSAVTQAALNAHKKHIYTSVCETAALTVWKSMPVIKEPAPQEIERKFNRIDRFWGPASFVLSLYYFWRVALSICYKTPMAWGWFEVIILLILGLMELGQIWLELHRPIDVKGQKVYKFPEIWRVQSRKTRFWLDVVSALPVAYVLIYWLQSDTTWVPFCFIIKWFNALWNLPSHFNDAMEKMRVDPIKGRIFRAAFIFVMTAHIMACVFFVVARTQGDEATQYITTIPNLVSGGKVLYPYIHAFDWAIKTMTGLSRGNGIPLTDVQHCLLLSTVTTGIILYALMITTISDALTTPSLEARHRDHLQMVNDTMVYQDLPQDFRKDVLAYYRYNFRSTGRVGGGDDEDPLGDLPYDFRSKIDCAIGSAILKRVPIFAKACENQKFLEVMVQKLQPQALMPETVVFHRGTVGDTMFFIVNGQVAVLADNGKEVVVLGAGAFFGEIAMLSDTERTATIVTKTYCHVLVLNKADFLAVSEQFTDSMASIKELAQSRVQALMKRQEEERRTLLGKVPLFAGAIEDAGFLEMMVQSLQSKVFAPEMFICHRGDVGDCMYFLVGGQVAILDAHGEEVVALGPGCFFGEIALLENIERTATIAAKMFCTTLLLSKQKFEEVEKMYPQPIQEIRKAAQPRIDEVLAAQSSDKAKLIQSVPIFKEAAETPGFVQMLVNALFSKVFPPNTFVCKRGDRGDCMYFVVSGSVAIIGEDLEEKVVLGPGTFFGEIALLMDTTRTATVRTKTTVTVMVFNRLDFNQCGHAYPTCLQTIRDASSERIAAAKRAEEEARLLKALDPS